jgi:PAS domain S-box-containing protein
MCDEEGKVTYLNDRRVAFTGRDPRAGYGDMWTTYIHPDDRKHVQGAFYRALKDHQPFSREYRLRHRDGAYRWLFDVAAPRMNGDGSFAGFIGSAVDVTDQKLAQEALQTVGGRLLEAQDEERKRIARELHDDISQKLALLSMELAQANRSANEEATKERLNNIRQHCSGIAKDIQSLSHQLHYSKLDYLGLVGALRGFCREFAKQYDVNVEFKDENVPRELPKQISLCLFRVTQEALHNAVKYSGTQEYAVKLSAAGDEVELVVSDAGAGFDAAEAMRNQGLGLVSMEERVHLVQGRFNIESKPGEGTKVVVSVPLIASASSAAMGVDQAASVQGAA